MGNKLASAKDVFRSGLFSLLLSPCVFMFIGVWPLYFIVESVFDDWSITLVRIVLVAFYGIPLISVYFIIKLWIKKKSYKAECRKMNVRPEKIAVIGGVMGFFALLSWILFVVLLCYAGIKVIERRKVIDRRGQSVLCPRARYFTAANQRTFSHDKSRLFNSLAGNAETKHRKF